MKKIQPIYFYETDKPYYNKEIDLDEEWGVTTNESLAKKLDKNYRLCSIEDLEEMASIFGIVFEKKTLVTVEGLVEWVTGINYSDFESYPYEYGRYMLVGEQNRDSIKENEGLLMEGLFTESTDYWRKQFKEKLGATIIENIDSEKVIELYYEIDDFTSKLNWNCDVFSFDAIAEIILSKKNYQKNKSWIFSDMEKEYLKNKKLDFDQAFINAIHKIQNEIERRKREPE